MRGEGNAPGAAIAGRGTQDIFDSGPPHHISSRAVFPPQPHRRAVPSSPKPRSLPVPAWDRPELMKEKWNWAIQLTSHSSKQKPQMGGCKLQDP